MPEVDKDVKLCHDWVDEGKSFMEKYGMRSEWDTYQRLYEHEYDKNVVPVNKVFSIMRSLVPRVYFRNPRVVVTPRRPGFYWRAQIIEKLDNWLLREKHFKEQIRLMIQDCFLCGIGIGIVGYDNSVAYSGETIEAENEKGERFEHNVNVKPGQPWFERINPRDVIFPYGTKSHRDAPWFGQKVVKYTEDIKNNPLFKEYDASIKNIKGTSVSEMADHYPKSTTSVTAAEFAEQNTLWIMRNARTREVMVMAEDYDKLLYKGADELQIEGLPLSVLTFNPTGRSIYGIPDTRIILPQQKLLNDINTLIFHHAMVSIAKFAVNQNQISKEELEKMTTEFVGAFIKIDGDPNTFIKEYHLTIPPELIAAREIVEQDIREEVGFSRQSAGEFSPGGRKTAQEVRTVDAALAIRIDERRDGVAEVLGEVVSKWNQFIFKFWNEPIVESIVGADGAPHWVQFTGADIESEYTYEIDPDDAVPVSGELRKMEAFQISAQLAQLPEINKESLIRQGMKHFPGWDVDELLRQPGTPPVPTGQPQGLDQFEQDQGRAEMVKPVADMAAMQQMAQMGGGGG